jgi:predicted O-methyltransferase YrrM
MKPLVWLLSKILPAPLKLILWNWYIKFRNHRLKRGLLGAAIVDVSSFGTQPVSDISEHLNFLYFYLTTAKPSNILELGTRGGESTKVLEKYCREMNIVGNSFDLEEAPNWLSQSKNWNHFVGDDLDLGKQLAQTHKWPNGSTFKKFDFIFLDTSHEYMHTKKELEIYVNLLEEGVGAIAFHDTNLTESPTLRMDGNVNQGWNNSRGVTRAIEEYFGFKFDERTYQMKAIANGEYLMYHRPWCNGFTILTPYRPTTFNY